MSASIRYINAMGRETSFGASSPGNALERLSAIRGYNATPMETAAIAAFGEAAKIGVIDGVKPQIKVSGSNVGVQSTAGRLTKESRLADIKMVDGKIVKVMQEGYRSENGAFFPKGTHEEAM